MAGLNAAIPLLEFDVPVSAADETMRTPAQRGLKFADGCEADADVR
jgi:hypothetical protein